MMVEMDEDRIDRVLTAVAILLCGFAFGFLFVLESC
jgi:hypothetical protein